MTVQVRIPSVFMRGGTSRALMFRREHLPDDPADWDAIFLAAIGSPDPNGRQLDGMGGGISSLSKVVVVGPPSRDDADVDYTFGQVAVDRPMVDYSGNCGNMSSAVGPFAVDEGLVTRADSPATVRIHNTNTGKLIVSQFALEGGVAAVEGDYELLGVAGHGARIRLEFLDPGGAATGRLLPSGQVTDALDIPGHPAVTVSLVDATNPCVFVAAESLGLAGTEPAEALEGRPELLELLEHIRAHAAVRMGLATSPEQASAASPSNPKIGVVAPPQSAATLSGASLDADAFDVTARMMSMGRPHRAVPLTGAMCLAVAARIRGTVVHQVTRAATSAEADIRVGHPSGVTAFAAAVSEEGGWRADKVVVYRTARRLMEGSVLVPQSRLTDSRRATA